MTPETNKRPWVALVGHILKFVVFAAVVVLIFKLFEDQRLLAQAERLSLGTIVGFFALMFAHRICVAYRWMSICRHQLELDGVSWAFLLRLNLVAEFVVIWLPSSLVAEGVRLWRMQKVTGNIQLSAASIVFDRIFGLLALILCIVPFLPTMQASDELALSPIGIALTLSAIAMAAVFGISIVRRYRGTILLLQRASQILDGIRIVSAALWTSCLSYLCIVLAHMFVFSELTTLGWLQMVPLVLVPLLGRVIPISIFGIGAVEGGTLLLGGILGVDKETLLLVAGLGLLSKYFSSTLGVLWDVALEGWSGFFDVIKPRADEPAAGQSEAASNPASE